LGALLRQRGQTHDLLRLRRAHPGGDPQERGPQRAARRRDHPGAGARPLLLRMTQQPNDWRATMLKISKQTLIAAVVTAAASAPSTAYALPNFEPPQVSAR